MTTITVDQWVAQKNMLCLYQSMMLGTFVSINLGLRPDLPCPSSPHEITLRGETFVFGVVYSIRRADGSGKNYLVAFVRSTEEYFVNLDERQVVHQVSDIS